jgi:hypothetical protein
VDRVFLKYAQARGFLGDPTVVRHPTGKPKVERGIPYAREVFFRGQTFRDLADLQARAVLRKSFLASALGHSACRAGAKVPFLKAVRLLQALHHSRGDKSFERELRN